MNGKQINGFEKGVHERKENEMENIKENDWKIKGEQQRDVKIGCK